MREIAFLLKICWSISCLPSLWRVLTRINSGKVFLKIKLHVIGTWLGTETLVLSVFLVKLSCWNANSGATHCVTDCYIAKEQNLYNQAARQLSKRKNFSTYSNHNLHTAVCNADFEVKPLITTVAKNMPVFRKAYSERRYLGERPTSATSCQQVVALKKRSCCQSEKPLYTFHNHLNIKSERYVGHLPTRYRFRPLKHNVPLYYALKNQ